MSFRLSHAEWALRALVKIEGELEELGDIRPVRATEIAEEISLSPGQLGGSGIDRLASAGLIERVERKQRRNRDDGYKPRALGYRTTEKGRLLLAAFRAELAAYLREEDQ